MRVLALLILALVSTGSTGCQQALFPKDTPRHQFQAHHEMRGRHVPLTEPDVFGNPRPALRARLSQAR
jgi:hypothetical protein